MRFLNSYERDLIEQTLQRSLVGYYSNFLETIGDETKRKIPYTKLPDDYIPQDKEWLIQIHNDYGVILDFKKIRY